MTTRMTERQALQRVVKRLEKEGWSPQLVVAWGGEDTAVQTPGEAVEEAEQVEDGKIYFIRPAEESAGWFMLAFCFNGTTGTDAVEVIADYHTGAFGDVIEAEIVEIEQSGGAR